MGELGQTHPVEVPAPKVSPPLAPSADGDEALPALSPTVARPMERAASDVLFVPLAVTVGDGFKFGCGFFLALVVTLLAALVVVAALFAAMSVAGLTLPLARA